MGGFKQRAKYAVNIQLVVDVVLGMDAAQKVFAAKVLCDLLPILTNRVVCRVSQTASRSLKGGGGGLTSTSPCNGQRGNFVCKVLNQS